LAKKQQPKGRDSVARDTKAALCAAARAEFREHGYGGTDSNKIARRAGFAPQTFYRWYKDKAEVFVAAYRAWEEEERLALEALLARGAKARAFAEAIVAHHREHLLFRRSLRQLAVSEPSVRLARSESRVRQAERIRSWLSLPKRRSEAIYVALFQIERLADAAAEGELTDLGLADAAALSAIANLIDQLGP
jgi:AcrR family transcriptional regulator